MDDQKEYKHDRVVGDIYEDIDDEEMHELVWEAQREALLEKNQEELNKKPKHRFPKWVFWLIAIVMCFNTFSILPEIYSIPAIDFLKTSAKLSTDKNIILYKKSVVAITTEDSKGTGFSISSDGLILTNNHVVEGNETVTVTFPDDGRYTANVVNTYPSIDIAVLEINGKDLPYLELAEQASFAPDEPIQFIGNPLNFFGIANEGTIIDYIKLGDWNDEVVMIKAPVYRGNSGSPILDKEGLVIGVIFATLNHDEYGKVGLFVPIEYYYEALETSSK